MLDTMEKLTLGKSGLQVSRLGFGAAPVGYLHADAEKVGKLLHEMIDRGVNLIDTAASYPGSEELLGQALNGWRNEVLIASKCGHRIQGLEGDAWSAQLIEQTIDQSLRRMKTDVIDIMMLHSCSQQVLEHGEAVEALIKARDAGKIRFLGYSGDNEAAAYAAGLEDISVLEVSVNIVDQANLKTVLPICRERNVGVIAKRPLANAAWKEITAQRGMYQQYAEVYTQRLASMNLRPEALGFQGHAEVEWPEIALRFVLSQPGVQSAIVGTTSVTNARANLAAINKGPLADDVVRQIEQAFEQAQADSGRIWPGQT